MSIGELRDKVKVGSSPDEPNNYGEESREFIHEFTTKANVKVISGVELIKAGAELSQEVISVLMRKDRRLKHDSLISYDDNVFEVISIKPVNKNRYVVVSASREIL